MKFVSVRALSILLSLTLVVVTAAICLSISVTTAEDALTKTESAGNNGINGAFDTASVNVKALADSLMAQILSTSVLFVNDFLDAQMRITMSNMEYFRILANTPTVINGQPTLEFFDYTKFVAFSRPFYGQIVSNPTSGIWVTNALGMHVLAMESTDTVGTTGPKEFRVLFNNGTDRTQKLKNTFFGAMDYRMQFLNKNNTCTGGLNCPYIDSYENNFGACPGSPFNVCPVMSRPFYDPLGMGYVPLAMGVAPEGSSWWTNVVSIPPYVGVALVAPVSSQYVPKSNITKQKVGLVGIGVDLRFISKFLQSLTLPEGSRIVAVEAINNPLLSTPTMGTIAGAGTGRSFTEYIDPSINNGTVRVPINCTLSDDNVTRDACLWVFNSGRKNPFITLDPNMTYEAELGGATHFVKTRLVRSGNGLVWSLILVTPRRTIMGAIDDAVYKTHVTIDEELTKTREDKERGYMIMYIILAVSAAVLIVASILFTLAITAPMIVLQEEMACVAMMKLEYVDLQRPTSGLEEVGSMQTSFLQMVSNLVEYRNYMPASILAGDDDEEETTMEASGVGKTIDGGEASFLDQSVNKQDKLESSFKPRNSVAHSGSHSQKSEMQSRAHAKKAQVSSMEVKSKRVTIMVMNLRRWHKIQQSMGPSESAALHSQYVKLVLETVNAQKGTPDVFMGDRFFASWNAIKQIGTHRTLACTTVVQVTAGLKNITEAELSITAGLATSEVRCGNMGCDGMKKFTFLGGCASLAPVLERLNRRYKTNVLMDGGVEEEAKNNFLLRKIDHISVQRIQEKTIRVFELLGAKKVSEDEWMYQLEEGDAANPYTAFSTAVDLYWKGSFPEAKALLEKCSVKDDALTMLTERVEAAILSNATGSPKVVDETVL